jgi:hypothetical protein
MIYLHYETFNISANAANAMGLDSTQMVRLKFASNKNRVSLAKYDFDKVQKNLLPLLKQIPSGKRKYDPVDYVWTIPASTFAIIRILVEHDGDPSAVIKHKDLYKDFIHFNWNQAAEPASSWHEQIRESEDFQQKVEAPEDFFKNNTTTITSVMTETEIKQKLALLIKPFINFDLNVREDFMRGYKLACRRLHPDIKGGDAAKMSELNSLWMQYKELV